MNVNEDRDGFKVQGSDISTPEPSEKDAERIASYAGDPKTDAQQEESEGEEDGNTVVHT